MSKLNLLATVLFLAAACATTPSEAPDAPVGGTVYLGARVDAFGAT